MKENFGIRLQKALDTLNMKQTELDEKQKENAINVIKLIKNNETINIKF